MAGQAAPWDPPQAGLGETERLLLDLPYLMLDRGSVFSVIAWPASHLLRSVESTTPDDQVSCGLC